MSAPVFPSSSGTNTQGRALAIIVEARKAYHAEPEIDAAWTAMEETYLHLISAALSPQAQAGETTDATEQGFLEDNIATVAFHLGQSGARLSVQHDKSGVIVDPGEVLKEISRRLSVAQRPVNSGEPVAWLDVWTAGLDWQNRMVATNPQFVTNNGPENFAPLYASPPAALPAGEVNLPTLDEYRNNLIEECAKVAETQKQQFLSTQYAANQPFGSLCERFACEQVAKAIRGLAISSTPLKTAAPDIEIEQLRAVAWAAQGMLNADTYVSDLPREQAVREADLKLRQALGTWQMHHTAASALPSTHRGAPDAS